MLRLVKLIFGLFIRSFRARRDLLLRVWRCDSSFARWRVAGRSHGSRTVTDCYVAAAMVRMAKGPDFGPTGDRCALASSRVQAVLEMDFAVQSPRGQEADEQGNP